MLLCIRIQLPAGAAAAELTTLSPLTRSQTTLVIRINSEGVSTSHLSNRSIFPTTTPVVIMSKILVVLIVAFLIDASASVSAKRIHRRSLSMVWGANLKLGQSVVSTSPETTSAPKVASPGSENDSAGSSILSDEAGATSLITKIDLSLRQKSLLMALQDHSVPDAVKLERINFAATEGLLPASFQQSSVGSPKLSAGGLLDEWNFSSN